jgi:hypothetical protein
MKKLTSEDPTKLSDFNKLSADSQEQLKKSFEEGDVVDREFTGKPDSKIAGCDDYCVEHSKSSRAACFVGCEEKIGKGELRLGLLPVMPGMKHVSWRYCHW